MMKALFSAKKIVYLHCAAGGRCLKVAELLRAAGYETRPLKPGYEALLQAGLPPAK
jgi:phage shock protein E